MRPLHVHTLSLWTAALRAPSREGRGKDCTTRLLHRARDDMWVTT